MAEGGPHIDFDQEEQQEDLDEENNDFYWEGKYDPNLTTKSKKRHLQFVKV